MSNGAYSSARDHHAAASEIVDGEAYFHKRYTDVSEVIRYLGMVDSDYQNNRMNAFGDHSTHVGIEGHLQSIADAQRRLQQDTSVMVCVGALSDDAVHRIVGDVVNAAQGGGGAGELPPDGSNMDAGAPSATLGNHHLTVMDLHDSAFEDMGAHFDAMELRLRAVSHHMNTIHADVASVCSTLRAVDETVSRGS